VCQVAGINRNEAQKGLFLFFKASFVSAWRIGDGTNGWLGVIDEQRLMRAQAVSNLTAKW
jgi:hypothetical protein